MGNTSVKKITSEGNNTRNTSLKKTFMKTLLENNFIDPLSNLSRKFMHKLGVLNTFDDFYYFQYRKIFRVTFRKLWGYELTGEENFPKKGGAIVISNHQSELDPFLVGSACSRKVRWLSKHQNFNIPIFRSFITPFGTIPIRRGQSDEKALRKVKQVLENGGCIGIFPEGTRSPDGKIQEFRKGAARLCIESGVPYVPCAIRGAYIVFPKGQTVDKIKFRGGYQISVSIGKPVYIDPDFELSIENANFIKQEMRKDIQILHSGGMNHSRIIGKERMIFLDESIKEKGLSTNKSVHIKNQVPTKTTSDLTKSEYDLSIS